MTILLVQALGKLQLRYQDTAVSTFPTRHAEELLSYLLLHPQTPHSREKLITLLWPDAPPDKGRARLSTTLWRLRCLFDTLGLPAATCLHADREWVTFAPQISVQLDVTCFEKCLHDAATAADPVAGWETAVSLYQGELFTGLYADWCLVERERLARLWLHTLGQLMEHHLQQHNYTAVAAIGERILQEDPLREEVHRALIHCYEQMGDYAQAIKQFHICSDLLMSELGVLPLPETIILYSNIIAHHYQTLKPKSPAPAQKSALKNAFAEFLQAGERLHSLLAQAE
ncbi:MAG: tetratricopeptide repeat protein [Anaerolineales bacterium]|nr:tetratricopeptide repeat protein [Anaerolineales bacterium]